ncbi:MAG: AsmA family protein [Rhodocyclales bacterium]|nr:AsmA family protein [Rhodocyclales bacterium]
MKWFKRLLIALAVLLAIAAALPFLVSLNDYIPRIEQEVSARLKEPVSIKSIRFTALPLPHVAVAGITIGKADDIRLGTVTVTPYLSSLLQSTRVIRSIEIDSPVLTRKGIDAIAALVKSESARAPQQPPPVRVESIALSNVVVMLDKASFGPFDAGVRLDSTGAPEDASVKSQDGKFEALIKLDNSKYLIDAKAKAWTLPAGPALVFDELTIKGVATQNDATLDQISARLYGGTASGKMAINWKAGLRVEGNLELSRLELQEVAAMLSPGTRVSGKLDARPVFSAAPVAADQMMKTFRLQTPFNIQNGALHGVDIQNAATSLIKQGSTGGETRFEHLSGHLLVEHGSHHFTELKIASGALAADGRVSVSPKKELSGRINAQIKAVGTSANVPLNVGGTVGAPLLYPTGAAMAGAAVGTVLLGPGFGTSMGAKVGNWAERVFDKKR